MNRNLNRVPDGGGYRRYIDYWWILLQKRRSEFNKKTSADFYKFIKSAEKIADKK